MDSQEGTLLELSLRQRVARVYGVWWDTINTGVVLFLTVAGFLYFALAVLTDNLQWLPFQDIWKFFEQNVSQERQAEIGLSILSITVSAGSAAALFLLRQGTTRWAMNRRIGHLHQYFAEALLYRLSYQGENDNIGEVLRAFLRASTPMFEQIGDTHAAAQKRFELARYNAHRYLSGDRDKTFAINTMFHLFCSALICQYRIEIDERRLLAAKPVAQALPKILKYKVSLEEPDTIESTAT
jgi:hypothetical protein